MEAVEKPVTEADIEIRKVDDYYVVEGAWIERLCGSVNFDDYESRMYLDRKLRSAGVFQRLEDMGVQDGDFVVMGDMEFEYER
jgi:GTP-binding protein